MWLLTNIYRDNLYGVDGCPKIIVNTIHSIRYIWERKRTKAIFALSLQVQFSEKHTLVLQFIPRFFKLFFFFYNILHYVFLIYIIEVISVVIYTGRLYPPTPMGYLCANDIFPSKSVIARGNQLSITKRAVDDFYGCVHYNLFFHIFYIRFGFKSDL